LLQPGRADELLDLAGEIVLVGIDPCLQLDGLPITSGAVEGACRYLVKDRMDITGARWGLDTAESVLRLRGLAASGDIDDYFDFHEALELQRNHKSHYANDTPPVLVQPGKPRLRLVR